MIGYDLNEQLADREDLDQLKNMGINLKLDFILNHASAQSPQFRDLVEKKTSTVNMLGWFVRAVLIVAFLPVGLGVARTLTDPRWRHTS